MRDKFKEFLENLNYGELVELQTTMKNKESEISKILTNHIDVVERMNARVCASCGSQLNLQTKNLTLHFGPEDFKKKASFCAFDCLDFFISHLKDLEMKKEKAQKSI
ncbi:MAG TPA: hypothetical protein VKE88_00365 [Candidatus Nanoarchaeia archaeon]|nr:hypothetical protein [Candidatus Nanoarchaeia archaeon]